MPLPVSAHDLLSRRFQSRVVASPRGRAFVLSQAAAAEASDEGRIFDELLARIDDPELRRLVKVHQADEERHAELFAAAAARSGATPPPIPAELQLLERIDRELGGFFDGFLASDRSVMEAYLLLQVIEERATHQFQLLEPALRAVDPESADVVAGIARDEERHLKYCRAISRRYAPDEATRRATLARFREVEARAFGDHSRANLAFCLEHELVDMAPAEVWIWRQLLRAGQRRRPPVPTRLAADPA